jgi:hypothetical protein
MLFIPSFLKIGQIICSWIKKQTDDQTDVWLLMEFKEETMYPVCSSYVDFNCMLLLYTLSNIIREDEMSWAYNTHGRNENAYRMLFGKPERKRPLGRPRHRWENDIRIDFREVGWE